MAQVSFTELRQNLARHFDRVEQDREHLVVTRQGHPEMAILPVAELEDLIETMHLLGTPANARRLMRSIAQLEAGRGAERDLIEPQGHEAGGT
ncbi:type II toxin-antitoxin system Phd/YefM family antitoxin [Methylobacterium sp. JK268]